MISWVVRLSSRVVGALDGALHPITIMVIGCNAQEISGIVQLKRAPLSGIVDTQVSPNTHQWCKEALALCRAD